MVLTPGLHFTLTLTQCVYRCILKLNRIRVGNTKVSLDLALNIHISDFGSGCAKTLILHKM